MNNTVHFVQFHQMLLAVAAQRDKITEADSGLVIRVSLSGLITGVGSHEGLSCSEPERATSANPKGHKPPQTDTVHTLASAHSLHVCFPVSLVRVSSSGQGLGPCPPQNPCTGPTGVQKTHVKQQPTK